MPISGAWTYTLDGSDATITDYDTGVGGFTPTIPETLDGYNVIAIGNNALQGKSLTSITLSSNLQTIGNNAFNINSITSLTIPSNVISIGSYSFANNAISSLTLNNSSATLGVNCFYKNSFTTLTLPEGLTTLPYGAFGDNYYLTTLNLPSTLTTIGDYAFSYCALTNLTLHEGITTLGEYAFYQNNLTEITLPSTLTTLGIYIFGRNNISSLTLPESGLTYLSQDMFARNSLTSVTLPANITSVGNTCFYRNTNLSEVYVYNDSITFGASVLLNNMSAENKGTIYGNDPSNAKDWWTTEWTTTYNFAPLPPPQAISRVVITPEYGFQIDRWNPLLNGGLGDWGNVVYIGTEGQFHIDNGYLDMRKSVATCTDIIEQNRILIDPAIGIKIQKNIAADPTTPDWFDVFYVDEEGDIKLADENGNGIILDQFGMDTKFIKWFKNMCYNSSFEVYDSDTLLPTYWDGTGVVTGDSSWFGTVSCKLTTTGDYIQTHADYAINPNFYDDLVSTTNLTRIAFHKKRGKVKVEVIDLDNASQAYTLTDSNGNSGSFLEFDYNLNYIAESYNFNFDHFEFGPTDRFIVKFTNTDTTPYDAFIDAVIIEPDFTQRRPSFYTDGPNSISASVVGGLGAQIVVDTVPPSDTTKLWLDIN